MSEGLKLFLSQIIFVFQYVTEICMGRIVRKIVVLVCALNNVTPSMEHVYMDVKRDSMDLNVLKVI